MNPFRRMIKRIREYLTVASDPLPGTMRSTTRRMSSSYQPPVNSWQRSDYGFWRKAYYGQAVGLELSGLFVKPLCSKIAAWVLGRAPQWRCEDLPSQEALEQWWAEQHSHILQGYRSSKKQGDAFIVVNSDLTITLLAPDSVDPIVDAADYSVINGWRVTQTLQHPQTIERMTLVDEYYPDRRVHRVQVNGIDREVTTYPNLIGMLPIVLIANNPDAGQTFGHAEAEALLSLMHRYGEVLDAAIEGNIYQGRPTPLLTFDSVENLKAFKNKYMRSTSYNLPDGTSADLRTVDIDLKEIIVAAGANFEYKSPGNFSADVVNILEILFYLFLEHAEIPEFVMGNAISSSKASAETQMPVFERFIEGQQSDAKDWLTQVSEIVLAYQSLTMPGVVAQTPNLQWRKLTQDGRLTLDTIVWAVQAGLLDKRTALMLAPVEVEDIDAVLEAAEEEKQARARDGSLPCRDRLGHCRRWAAARAGANSVRRRPRRRHERNDIQRSRRHCRSGCAYHCGEWVCLT